jgi:hypothetical protein
VIIARMAANTCTGCVGKQEALRALLRVCVGEGGMLTSSVIIANIAANTCTCRTCPWYGPTPDININIVCIGVIVGVVGKSFPPRDQ